MSRPAACIGATAALCAMLLAGCTVGPRYEPPTPDAPTAWKATDAVPPGAALSVVSPAPIQDNAWWASFHDAELTSLVGRALTANLDARQAVLRIDEARAQRRIAAAGAWPALDATASYTDTRISERTSTSSIFGALGGGKTGAPPGVAAAIPGLVNPFSQYQYGLTGSWEIDLFGRIRRQVEAADADTAAAAEDARAVRVSLMAEVAGAYIDLRAAQARRAVTEENVATAQALVKLATDARAEGLGDDLDVASGKAELATAQATLPPLQTEIATDESQLALLLAAKPGALSAELENAKAIPPVPLQVPVGLPAELARRRPDIREAEARLHAAVALQGVAVANLYPRFTLDASFGLEASNPASLATWAARYFAAGPGLNLPVFDAGQRRQSVYIADIHAKEAALAYAQTVLAALHEVEDAITAYDQEQSRRAALQTAQSESRAALALAEQRYRAGSVSFRDVLDAQDRLQGAELALTTSTAATSEDLVTLYKALGGGWQAGEAGG